MIFQTQKLEHYIGTGFVLNDTGGGGGGGGGGWGGPLLQCPFAKKIQFTFEIFNFLQIAGGSKR